MWISNIIERIKLPFRKEKELFSALYSILGFYPRNIQYYKQALLHKSIGRRTDKGRPLNNERLEYLGDAMLDAIVGYIVYRHFEGKREGFLTTTRAKLVSRETLGRLADEMGLTQMILSSYHSNSHNNYVGGNAFEALVGAIYMDRGYEGCLWFWENRVLGKYINLDKLAFKEMNFKSKLLEWGQRNKVRLEYCMLKQKSDNNGCLVFSYQVKIEGIEGCSATGYSKKEAQQMASQATLQKLKREPQFVDAVFKAKSDRTKMEEEPTMLVPDPEEEIQSFIVEHPKREPERDFSRERESERDSKREARGAKSKAKREPVNKKEDNGQKPAEEEFDLSDITAREKSREQIIAEAEAAAEAYVE